MAEETKNQKPKGLEYWWEGAMWSCRFVVVTAVVVGILSAVALFLTTTVNAVFAFMELLPHYLESLGSPEARAAVHAGNELHVTTVTSVVSMLDGFLLATVLLIFAFGLYELFVSRLDKGQENRVLLPGVLQIRDIDDLKSRLSKVVLLILIVHFFNHAMRMRMPTEPTDLLILAGGITLIGLSLYLSHLADNRPPIPPSDKKNDDQNGHGGGPVGGLPEKGEEAHTT